MLFTLGLELKKPDENNLELTNFYNKAKSIQNSVVYYIIMEDSDKKLDKIDAEINEFIEIAKTKSLNAEQSARYLFLKEELRPKIYKENAEDQINFLSSVPAPAAFTVYIDALSLIGKNIRI